MKKSLSFALLICMFAVFFTSCGGGSSTFKIVNLTGIDFYGVMMSPASQSTWSDVLPNDKFPNGSEATITISGNKDQAWDIRLFQDPDDLQNGYIDFSGIDLTGRSKLSLLDNGDGNIYWELE